MNISITTAALAGLLLAGSVADASAWTRHGTVTTPRGNYAVHGSGGCAGGVCNYNRTVRGPYGGTVARSGTVVRTGPGQYNYQGSVTGPYGRTVTRSGTAVHTGPGQYNYQGSATGPYGGTVTRSGTVVRY
jgi:hypothetical protein